MSETRLPIHPYAELFPPMSSPEFDQLCGSIATLGLEEEIVLHEGKVLEGRHRYLACLARQVTPRFRNYAGECGSPLAFVVAKNLHRRHLTESQRAMLGAKLRPLFEKEARQRQETALKKGKESPVGPNLDQREKHEENGRSAQQAASMVKVSKNSVHAAATVQKRGIPGLVEAVQADQVSVSAAAKIAKLPADQQQQALAQIKQGIKPKEALDRIQGPPQDAGAPLVDDSGQPLPEPAIPAFKQRKELVALCRQIDTLCRDVERLGNSPLCVHLQHQSAQAHLRRARNELWTSQPAHICPNCAGRNPCCSLCRGHGWVPKSTSLNTSND
jgi:hypothetical protein